MANLRYSVRLGRSQGALVEERMRDAAVGSHHPIPAGRDVRMGWMKARESLKSWLLSGI